MSYIVTGFILVYLFSRRTEACIRVEVEATSEEAAARAVLARHQSTAERTDPQATVVWQERPSVLTLA